ncbi:MAG: tetratricopeptide repeat protein [Lachnospiraceae bacterium]|nr:tetratricopeptide repeat protein [Lachnospiraceae bacterium]
MFCEHCGKQIDNDSKFCVSCGQAVQPLVSANKMETSMILTGASSSQKSKKKKWWIIPVIVSVILCAGIVLGILLYNRPEAKTKRYMKDARAYLDEMDYAQAIATYEKIIEIDPKNVDAYIGLAEANAGIGLIDKAIEILAVGYEQTEAAAIIQVAEDYVQQLVETSPELMEDIKLKISPGVIPFFFDDTPHEIELPVWEDENMPMAPEPEMIPEQVDYSYLKAYADYLRNNRDSQWDCFNSASGSVMYGAEFALWDVDLDGDLDLIIYGFLGLRCKMLSEICIWNGTGFDAYGFDGQPTMIKDNVIWFDDPDYEGAGEVQWTGESAVRCLPGGQFEWIQSHYMSVKFYDYETGEYMGDDGVVDFNDYVLYGQAVSSAEYDAAATTNQSGAVTISYTSVTPEAVDAYFANFY